MADIMGQPSVFSNAFTRSSPILRRDVEAARLLGETLHIEDALRARPTEARELIADDMNGQSLDCSL